MLTRIGIFYFVHALSAIQPGTAFADVWSVSGRHLAFHTPAFSNRVHLLRRRGLQILQSADGASPTTSTSPCASDPVSAAVHDGRSLPIPRKGTPAFVSCKAVGVGYAVPTAELTNADLEKVVETTDEWIQTRTGIKKRRILNGESSLQDLAASASRDALSMCGLKAKDVDLVILATSSPDDLFGDATYVANAIGACGAVAFDLTAACSGFLFGMVTASQFIQTGVYRNVLLIGADALSRWVDWSDRNTCILFGDGAGAAVLQAASPTDQAGILGFSMKSDGRRREQLTLAYGGSDHVLNTSEFGDHHVVTRGSYKPIYMNGREVFKFATREVPTAIQEALDHAGITIEQVDWLLLHQANIRIMDSVADRLGLSRDKVLANLEKYGNTSAASIPIALAEAVGRTQDVGTSSVVASPQISGGRVKKGDIIAMAGFGAGLSWGAAIVRW
uniref:beta-ketoacyl-[acyl-carrier-protein] synthase III n=1 Tax=Vitrella brassicaformis TaxID=1169539 RepID=A0A7S1KKN6_9ALVE|mmetsp:Transcript_8993/g.22074  ORF Transcript_8993/g.22074 Transcript_8993/m.22074 type:complete len:447 (+) Transcript_8993:177-1517(+)